MIWPIQKSQKLKLTLFMISQNSFKINKQKPQKLLQKFEKSLKVVLKLNTVVMSSLNIMKIVQIARPCQRLILTSERHYCYMSSYHTNNLYPGTKSESRFAKFDLNKLPTKDQTFSGVIPMSEIDFNYSLGSGPGGQNVQKVNILSILTQTKGFFSLKISQSF